MGVQGKRPQRKLEGQFKEPDLIVDVDSILRKAATENCIDEKGNLLLDKIAEMYDIQVLYEDLPSTESGYFRSQSGKYTIGINVKHHKKRQRFTLAHELGHYCLHRGKNDVAFEDEVLYRIENSSSIEYAANEFAARLLIPQDRLEKKIEEGMTDLAELADYFEVSQDAMRYRVLSLNYSITTNE
jgi:Zn-dependent peptidase ImmA (M78 family)